MTSTYGIAITFPDGTVHLIRTMPDQHAAFHASITRHFNELAHDGKHDHDHFMDAEIEERMFDPATAEAQVWPDVVSYMQTVYGLQVDPERDEAAEYFESFVWELVPPTEPFNVVDAMLRPDGQWQAGCDPVISFVIKRDVHDGNLQVFDGMEALTGSDFTSAHTAHRPSAACSNEWSTEPTCTYAAGHLRWVIEEKAKQQAEKGLDA